MTPRAGRSDSGCDRQPRQTRSPAGEAKQHFHNRLFGRSHEQREQFRQRILAVTLDDLQRVAAHYLSPESASTAVITGHGQLDATAALREELQLEVQEL